VKLWLQGGWEALPISARLPSFLKGKQKAADTG
jgi:hypothetical protein